MSKPLLQDLIDAASAAYDQYNLFEPSGLVDLVRPDLLSLEDTADGFFAKAFMDNGNVVVSFEGSILNPFDSNFGSQYNKAALLADGLILLGQVPQTIFNDAIAFVREVQKDYLGDPVYVVGHSLGGAEAEEVAYEASINALQPIAGGATFGAPGLPGYLGFGVQPTDFVDYVDPGDPVGNYARDAESELSDISATGSHFGTVLSTGSFLHEAILQIGLAAADISDINPVLSTAILTSSVLSSAALYHRLANYAEDLGETDPAKVEQVPVTTADPSPVVQFNITPYNSTVNEDGGKISFTITPTIANFSGTVYVSTVNSFGVSIPSANYYYSGILNKAITFSNGQPITVDVDIVDRDLTSGSESFSLIVQTSPNDPYATFVASAPFTIVNNDPLPSTKFTITTSTPVVQESDGLIRFTITRNNTNQAETVYLSTVHDQGSGNPNGDYYYQSLLNQPITFGIGQSSIPVVVSVNDVELTSGSETFRLIAQQNPTDAYTTSLASTDFTIDNTDVAPTYAISPAPASVTENGGSLIFTITRQGSTAQGVWVYVSTEPNTDTNNSNYYYDDLVHQAVYFSPGQSAITAPPIQITDHDLSSGSETFGIIVQQAPTDPTSTSLAATTFTINNTDAPAPPLTGVIDGTETLTDSWTLSTEVDLDRNIVNGTLINSVLQNEGTLTIVAGGKILSDGTAGDTVFNLAGGLFIIDAPTTFEFMPTFHNAGLMVVSPGVGNTFEITSYLNYPDIAFDNTGTVEVQSGVFDVLQGGSSNASGFQVATGATVLFTGADAVPLTFTGGTYRVAGVTQVGDTSTDYWGNLVFATGTTVDIGTSWQVDGSLDLSAATLIGSFTALNMDDGRLNLGANAASFFSVIMKTSSVISDSGRITLEGNSQLDGNFFGGGAVDNLGTMTIADQLYLANTATFDNEGTILGGALITGEFDNGINATFSGSAIVAATVNNAGLLDIGGNGIGFLNNTGTIRLQSGQAYLTSGFSNASGFDIEVGATVGISGTWTFDGGILNTGGQIVNGGTWIFSTSAAIATPMYNAGLFEVQSGTLSVQAALNYSGTIALDSGATLALSAPGSFSNSISGLAVGNAIDLIGILATSATVNSSNQLVVMDAATTVATLQLSGSIPSGSFYVTPDGTGGSRIVVAAGPPPEPLNLTLSPSSETGIPGDGVTTQTTPEITGLGQPGYAVTLYDGFTQLGNATADDDGSWTITTDSLSLGEHVVVAREAPPVTASVVLSDVNALETTTFSEVENQSGPSLALMLDVVPPPRVMLWTGADDTNLGNASNWDDTTNGLTPAQIAPDPTDTIEFDSSSGAISGSGTVSIVNVGSTGAGVLQLSDGGTLFADSLDVGIGSDDVGQVGLTGAGTSLVVTGNAVLADNGTGILSVLSGAAVTAESIDAGALANSAGIVTVSGINSNLTTTGSFAAGDSGVGEVSFLNGSTVTIGGDLNIGQLTGGSGVVDVENTTGTVILGGNINIGVGGGSAEFIIGVGSHVQFENGGETVGKLGRLIQHAAFDPKFLDNAGVVTVFSGTTPYLAYANNTGTVTQDAAGDQSVIQSPTFYGAGGQWQVNTGNSRLEIGVDGISSGQTFAFTDDTGTLVLGIDQLATIDIPPSGTNVTAEANPNLGKLTIGGFDGTISGFAVGDSIIVDTSAAAGFAINGSVVSVVNTVGGATEGTLAFANAVQAALAFGAPGALTAVACFAAGTRIEAGATLVAVEDLALGDQVRLHDGGVAPVVWLGSRWVDCTRHPDLESVWPVRVAAGAFGANVPLRDLYLSPDHAVFVNKVLVPVKLLINGTSIAQVRRDRVRYFHVELPEHAVILAEGLAVESYLDTGDKSNFHREGAAIRLFPNFAASFAPETAQAWEMHGAAPLVMAGKDLVAARKAIHSTGGWPPLLKRLQHTRE